MKITGQVPPVSGVYNNNKNIGKIDSAYGVSSKKDVLSISNKGKDFQTALRVAKDIPDVRQGRVDEISERYNSGSYDVSGRDIAEKVVSSVFEKKA